MISLMSIVEMTRRVISTSLFMVALLPDDARRWRRRAALLPTISLISIAEMTRRVISTSTIADGDDADGRVYAVR
jgi:hypothetical protein